MNINIDHISTLQFDILSTIPRDQFISTRRVADILESTYRNKCLILSAMLNLQSFSSSRNHALVVRNDAGRYRLTENGELALKAWKAGFAASEKRLLTEASKAGTQPAMKS